VPGAIDVEELVASSADPGATAAALARLDHDRLDASGAAPAVAAVTGAARWAADVLSSDPEALDALGRLDQPIAVDGADPAELARTYRRELLRIAARDLLEIDDLRATTAALSAAAAAAIAGSLAQQALDDRAVAVIGMGKLGAGELNFASDVDLLLVAEDPASVEAPLRRAMEALRACVRVDLDLRPEGRDGAMVRTVDGYVAYWERWAQPWERQALMKARAVAGDAELGARFGRAAAEAVWDRPFTAEDIRSIRSLKERSEAAVASRGLAGRQDIKRGLGGIRDVEFAVQLLALVHGGDDPTLRRPATLDALSELADGGYVAADDAGALADAYTALRRAEHHLQLVDLRPAHVLPVEPAPLDRLARSLGHRASGEQSAGDVLVERLRQHRAVARAVHERLWFRPLLGAFAGRERALAAFGFAEVARTSEGITELTRGLGRSSRLMRQLLPLVLDWLSRTPDPDLGLLGLRRLAQGPARSTILVDAFRDSPEVARRLCTVLGTSRLLGDLLVRHPDAVPALGDDADGLRARTPSELAAAARGTVGWRDADDRRRGLKRVTDREGLRLGSADLLGALSTREVGVALTDLAATAMHTAVSAVGVPGLAVVALGRFGAGELSYPSDLDVVFVCAPEVQPAAERAALALLRFLDSGPGPLYAVDVDLRPEGRDGPLVRTVDAWAAYVQRWAQPWERLAWVKARPVAGDLALGQELVQGVLGPWVWDRPVTDAERLELRRVKVRVEQERIRPGDDRDFHLKLGHGGLTDIEFCVQLLQLEHGVRLPGTDAAMAELRRMEVLSAAEHAALADAHGYLEAVRNRLFLTTGEPRDGLPSRAEDLARLARSLGTTPAALRERHRKVTRRARRVVEQRFFGA
jgi:glutamate-ammonia-ligase adenylyltransferase